jgi:hypothetical protein
MRCSERTVAVADQELARRIRLAISDPGAVVPRDGGPVYESVLSWQVGAVMAIVGPLVAVKDAPAGEDGAALIAAERRRQVTEEGWTPEHDAQHRNGELIRAAAVYATDAADLIIGWWPRGWEFKADSRVRMLAKAGALIAAEIDRLLAEAAEARR